MTVVEPARGGRDLSIDSKWSTGGNLSERVARHESQEVLRRSSVPEAPTIVRERVTEIRTLGSDDVVHPATVPPCLSDRR
jgi:hypothetical protein